VIVGRLFLLRGGDPRQVLELAYDRAQRDNPGIIDSSIATAELALEKQDFALALGSLQKAVEVEADNPLVYFLLSRALAPTDPARAAAALEKALELNPSHLLTRLFLAERLTDQEQYDAAHEQLMQVLQVNPRHSQAWAYMAVIAHLENDLSGEQAWHTIASQWPEEDVDVDYWIGLKLSQKYRFTEGSSYQRRALVKNPLHTRARIQLSQDLLRLGKEKEGWQLADAVNQQASTISWPTTWSRCVIGWQVFVPWNETDSSSAWIAGRRRFTASGYWPCSLEPASHWQQSMTSRCVNRSTWRFFPTSVILPSAGPAPGRETRCFSR